jgi:hypothetical protein
MIVRIKRIMTLAKDYLVKWACLSVPKYRNTSIITRHSTLGFTKAAIFNKDMTTTHRHISS